MITSLAASRLVITADDPAWDAWLEVAPCDVYHAAGMHRYARDSGEGEPYLVIAGDRHQGMAWPYLLRRIPLSSPAAGPERTDVTSVYGYPGPVAWGCAPGDPFLAACWTSIVDAWRDQGAVSAFTRFHPLLGNASLLHGSPWPREPGDPDSIVALGPTVSIDLAAGIDRVRSGYSHNLRRQIPTYRAAGLQTTPDEDWGGLPEFASLYHDTMVRAGADPSYLFGESDFERLRAALPGRVHLLLTRLGAALAAGGLVLERSGILHLHLVATNGAMSSISPYKVLVDDVAAWGVERGSTVLHLGGGRGGRMDSLFEFKRRFSPRQHAFSIGRWILDRPAYRTLTEAHAAEAGDAAVLDPGYFPAYRAPVASGRYDDE